MSKKIKYDRDRYREVCKKNPELPIFFQDWWLDVACEDGTWEAMLYEEDPNVVAVMPWFKKRRGPFQYITMPALTKFAGPYFLRSFSERKQHSILVKMVEAMPKVHGCQQTLHYQIQNWLPYKWQGFEQTAYYSYILPDIRDLHQVYNGIDADYRNNKFRKAEQLLSIRKGLDLDQLFDICKQPFIRQGDEIPVSESYFKKLLRAVEAKGQGTSLYTIDLEGQVQAAIYLIWDQCATYLLLTGEYEQHRAQGSGLFTLWKGIEYAHQNCQGIIFDFLGGMSEGVERTRRQFGAKQITYFYLWKKKLLFGLLQQLFR